MPFASFTDCYHICVCGFCNVPDGRLSTGLVLFLPILMENMNGPTVSNKEANKDILGSCVRCKQPIKVGLKCTRCGRLTHKACVKLLKNATVLDSSSIICCDNLPTVVDSCVASDPNVTDVITKNDTNDILLVKIKYLEEIIKQKDLIIENQNIAINALTDQISLLKQSGRNDLTYSSVLQCQPAHGAVNRNTSSSTKLDESKVATPSSSLSLKATLPITTQDVSSAIHSIEARRICDNIINIESDRKVDRPLRSRKIRNVLVGNATEPESCPFKAASFLRLKHFHATNFDVCVDEQELLKYLRGFAPNVEVRKLVSRNPTRYSSFKISVPYEDVDKIVVAEIWPKEVVLNNFFRSKRLNNE